MKHGTARRIATNFASLMAGEVISKLLQLVLFVFLAQALGKEEFGIFSLGIAFALLTVIIADFGLTTLLIREISRNKSAASKYLSNAIIVKALLSIVTIVSAYLFLNLLDYTPKVKLVAYIMLSFTLIQSFTNVHYSIFRAFERMHYDASIKIFRMVILAISVIYIVKQGHGLVIASLAFPLTEIIVLVVTASIVYTKFIKIRFEFDYSFSKKLLKKSSLFCLSLVFAGLFTYTDSIMLSKIHSTTEVGIYAAAANITLALIFISLMYGNAIYPVISRFFISSKKSLKLAYERSFKYMFIIILPISAGLYAMSDKIIALLYGPQYAGSAIVLSILSGYLFLRSLNIVSGFTLSSINKQKSRVFSQGTVAIINIILNLILIPTYGFIGAAIATLITEIVFFLLYTSFIIRYGLRIRPIHTLLRPLIAVAIMVLALSFIDNLFIAVILGGSVYLVALLVLGTIDKEDKLIFNKVIKDV